MSRKEGYVVEGGVWLYSCQCSASSPSPASFPGRLYRKKGDSGKSIQGIKDHSFLFIVSSFLSPLSFFLSFSSSSEFLRRMSLNVGTACLVSSKSFNAPASEIFCIVEMNRWCMWNTLTYRLCTPVKDKWVYKLYVFLNNVYGWILWKTELQEIKRVVKCVIAKVQW